MATWRPPRNNSRPEWNDLKTNLDQYKLSPSKRVIKKIQSISRNQAAASEEYQAKIQHMRNSSPLRIHNRRFIHQSEDVEDDDNNHYPKYQSSSPESSMTERIQETMREAEYLEKNLASVIEYSASDFHNYLNQASLMYYKAPKNTPAYPSSATTASYSTSDNPHLTNDKISPRNPPKALSPDSSYPLNSSQTNIHYSSTINHFPHSYEAKKPVTLLKPQLPSGHSVPPSQHLQNASPDRRKNSPPPVVTNHITMRVEERPTNYFRLGLFDVARSTASSHVELPGGVYVRKNQGKEEPSVKDHARVQVAPYASQNAYPPHHPLPSNLPRQPLASHHFSQDTHSLRQQHPSQNNSSGETSFAHGMNKYNPSQSTLTNSQRPLSGTDRSFMAERPFSAADRSINMERPFSAAERSETMNERPFSATERSNTMTGRPLNTAENPFHATERFNSRYEHSQASERPMRVMHRSRMESNENSHLIEHQNDTEQYRNGYAKNIEGASHPQHRVVEGFNSHGEAYEGLRTGFKDLREQNISSLHSFKARDNSSSFYRDQRDEQHVEEKENYNKQLPYKETNCLWKSQNISQQQSHTTHLLRNEVETKRVNPEDMYASQQRIGNRYEEDSYDRRRAPEIGITLHVSETDQPSWYKDQERKEKSAVEGKNYPSCSLPEKHIKEEALPFNSMVEKPRNPPCLPQVPMLSEIDFRLTRSKTNVGLEGESKKRYNNENRSISPSFSPRHQTDGRYLDFKEKNLIRAHDSFAYENKGSDSKYDERGNLNSNGFSTTTGITMTSIPMERERKREFAFKDTDLFSLAPTFAPNFVSSSIHSFTAQ